MDIKLYANTRILEGLEANGHSVEDLKERLRQTMLDMSSLDPRTDVSTDVGTDANERLDDLEGKMRQLQDMIMMLRKQIANLESTVEEV